MTDSSVAPAVASPAGGRTAELVADLIAGVSIAGLLLPEAVAYASIANVPPAAGVIALFAGLTCYALIGTSRFAVVSATSSSAAVLAAASSSLANGDPTLRMALAFGLVVATGALFLVAASLRLGSVSDFIAKPVLRGFAFGLSIVIIVKQLPTIVGVSAHHADVVRFFLDLVDQAPAWNPYSVATGALALAALFLLAPAKRLPGALVVIVVGIIAAQLFDLQSRGVVLVGQIPLTLHAPGLSPLPRQDWIDLAELGIALLLVLYAESSSSIRNYALLHGEGVSPNRDLLALGVANIVSGLMQGMAVGAGFSATSANEAAGAQSRLAGAVAAVVILIVVLSVLPLVALTPAPILAAIVIHAVSHSLRIATFKPYLLWRRDRVVAAGAILAVIALGVLNGLIAAVAISLLMLMSRLSRPSVASLGRLGESHDYVDVRTHSNAQLVPGVLIVRPEAPLFFANAERMLTQIRHLCHALPDAHAVVVSLEETQDLDGTTIEAIQALVNDMAREGRRLYLARLKDPVIEVLARAQLTGLAPTAFGYFSVDDAVSAARASAAEISTEVYA